MMRVVNILIVVVVFFGAYRAVASADVGAHISGIEMSRTYDYRYTSGSGHSFNFDAAVRADDTVSSIVMTVPGGSNYTLVLEMEDAQRWFNYHVSSSSEVDLADFTTGTYTFTVNYIAGGSDVTTVLYALPGGAPIPPVTQQPVLLYPSNGAVGIPVPLTFTFEAATDPAWAIGLEWETTTGSGVGSVEGLASSATTYGPVALDTSTDYEVTMTINHVVSGTNPDGIPTVVDADAEELFTFTTGGAMVWPLEVGQVWIYQTVDSRQPGSPWTTEFHVLETVEIGGYEYYHLGLYESNTGIWETGVFYVRSDDQMVYIWDEGQYKEWALSTMVAVDVSVPYGEFEGYRTTESHEEGWLNWFVPGVGLVKSQQVEQTYTVTDELVAICRRHPVYRFWSPWYLHHFYTISDIERDYVLATWPDAWTYEGPVYYAYQEGSVPEGTNPVYRFWSDTLGGHFYTISEVERDYVLATWPDAWTYEGIVYYAYPEGSQPAGTSPVYRFWSDALGGHFYTISETEKDYVLATWPDVWTYEGIAWYAYD